MQGLTIGKLAKRAGVNTDTVRFYERAGLLPKAQRTASGYRLYAPDDADRLRFIRRAKTLGFTLEEVAELLRLSAGKGGRASVRTLAQRRLHDLNQKIAEMTAIRDALAGLVKRCSGDGPVSGCPIVKDVLAQAPHACKEH